MARGTVLVERLFAAGRFRRQLHRDWGGRRSACIAPRHRDGSVLFRHVFSSRLLTSRIQKRLFAIGIRIPQQHHSAVICQNCDLPGGQFDNIAKPGAFEANRFVINDTCVFKAEPMNSLPAQRKHQEVSLPQGKLI
jgi:hypothetical protein